MKRLAPALAALAFLLLAPSLSAQPHKAVKFRGKTTTQWLGQLTHDGEKERRAALWALVSLGEAAKKAAVPVLLEMLEDQVPEFQAFAAEGLGQLGPTAKAAIPALTSLLLNRPSAV